MEPFSIGMLISGIVAAISSVVGGVTNAIQTQKINQKSEELMRETWDKQSIASHVQELEDAGLNKQLATGYSPNYAMTAQLKTPDFSQAFQAPGKLMDMFKGLSSMSNMKQQTDNARKQNEILQKQADLLDSQKLALDYKNEILKHDKDIIINRDILSTDNGLARQISNMLSLLGGDNAENLPIIGPIIKAANYISSGKFSLNPFQLSPEEQAAKEEEKKNEEYLGQPYHDAWRKDNNSVGSAKYNYPEGRR